ncbi:MAG: hypothetical protein KAY37_03575 [Phycisphaerae bacterium]|nr:hypothetical protein [Phycisphaerae bacterium]
MTRIVYLSIVGLMCAVSAAAQVELRPTPARNKVLEDEAKLRWICERLDLQEQQSQQVEALLTIYDAELEESKKEKIALLRKMQEKLAERDKAKADGNYELVRELEAELRNMGPRISAENNFFESLMQILTAEQIAKLPRLRAQVKTAHRRPPTPTPTSEDRGEAEEDDSGGQTQVRSFHVLKVTCELGLTPVQNRQLEGLLEDFRNNIRVDPPKQEADFAERVERLVKIIRPILTADQAVQYDWKVAGLRRSASAPQPFAMPGSPPRPPAPRQSPTPPVRPQRPKQSKVPPKEAGE